MRLALLIALLVAFAASAAFAGLAPAGSLSIEDGRGSAVIKGKGIVIGRLERGEVQIVDLTPLDQWSPRVNGVPRGKTVWTRGKDINFYVPGGRYRVTVRGEGFSVSARGQGLATLDAVADAAGATGTYAIGDSPQSPLPEELQRLEFGPSVVAPTSGKGTP